MYATDLGPDLDRSYLCVSGFLRPPAPGTALFTLYPRHSTSMKLDSVKKAMRSLALEAIMRPESLVELRDLLTQLSQQHPGVGPRTAKLLTALSACAKEGRAAPPTPIEDAIHRLLTADPVKGALRELARMTPESLTSLRYSLIALDLLDLPALPVANLLKALRSKRG